MSELIRRSQEANRLADDASLPKGQRLARALQAFSGLELTGMAASVREPLEAGLVGVNRILAQYSLQREEDYESIGDADLQQMREMIGATTSQAIVAELERIVASLDTGVEKLPVDAIREARQHRDLMTPRLIEALEHAARAARAGDVPEGNLHFYALFLLTEFRAREALPAILEAVSLPGDLPFDLFGDAITSDLSRVLAALAGDQPEILDALIRNQEINKYVRWEAAQTYLLLVRDKRMRREEAVERLRGHLREALQEEDAAIAGPLITELNAYAPHEAMEEIEEAYRRDLVDTLLIRLATVAQGVSEGEAHMRQALEHCEPTGFEDTVAELETWAAFREEPLPPPSFQPLRPPLIPMPEEDTDFAGQARAQRKVGRNDPCPCGSGKKFKRCCGAGK